MSADDAAPAWFVALSAALTGHTPGELWQTGLVAAHHREIQRLLPPAAWAALARASEAVVREGDPALAALLEDATTGPVARALTKLWYLGTWSPLPHAWREAHGAHPDDRARVASAQAHVEALVWPAIGANPMGAKGPGFGSWASPPKRST